MCTTVSRAALTKTCNSAWSQSCYILVPPSPALVIGSMLSFCLFLSILSLLLYSVWLTSIVALEFINFISAHCISTISL